MQVKYFYAVRRGNVAINVAIDLMWIEYKQQLSFTVYCRAAYIANTHLCYLSSVKNKLVVCCSVF